MSDFLSPISAILRIEPITQIFSIGDTDPSLYQTYASTLTNLFAHNIASLPFTVPIPPTQEKRSRHRFKRPRRKSKEMSKVDSIMQTSFTE